MSYTQQEEDVISGAVADFDYAVSRSNWAEAMQIIKELKGLEYEIPANRLAQELARKRLHAD